MKRAAIVFAVLSVLILADGLYLELGNNQQGCGCQGDSGTLFGGSTSINLSTGTEVVICGGFLLIVAGIFWVVGMRRERGLATGSGPAQVSKAQASPAQASPAQASPAQVSPAQASPAEASKAEASPAEASKAEASKAETQVGAGQGQVGKGSGDQH